MTYIINHNSMHVIFNYNIYFNDVDASDNDADDDDDDDDDDEMMMIVMLMLMLILMLLICSFLVGFLYLSIITFHNCILYRMIH